MCQNTEITQADMFNINLKKHQTTSAVDEQLRRPTCTHTAELAHLPVQHCISQTDTQHIQVTESNT